MTTERAAAGGAWRSWVLPFLVSASLAVSASVSVMGTPELARDTPGVGAAGALTGMIALAAGFLVSAVTTVAGRIRRRSAPPLILSLVLSVLAGAAVGRLALHSGAAAGAILVLAPALASWHRRPAPVSCDSRSAIMKE